jgi:hypothetical protein
MRSIQSSHHNIKYAVRLMSDVAVGEVCIANIGPKQRQMRLNFGLAGFALTAMLLIALIALGAPVWARVLVFLPAMAGAIGVWQYREKT